MKHTIVICSSNGGMEEHTRNCLSALQAAGGALYRQSGSADVAFARNQALTQACEVLEKQTVRDVVLMVDDDMGFDVETAQKLVDRARRWQVPVAAPYATTGGLLSAVRYRIAEPDPLSPDLPKQRWLSGLGLMAIPGPMLLELQNISEHFKHKDGTPITEFCWTCVEDGEWVAEDFRLCRRFNGVVLLPVLVWHIKKQHIAPSDETLADIALDRELPAETEHTREELVS